MLSKELVMYGTLGVLLVLQVVAMSTEYWSVKSGDGSAKTNMGLWKWCMSVPPQVPETCSHLPVDGDKTFPKNSLYAVRSFAVLSSLLTVGALACVLMKKMQYYGMLLAGAGICSLVACTIWSAELLKPNDQVDLKYNVGYSFYINLVAGLGAIGASLVYMQQK